MDGYMIVAFLRISINGAFVIFKVSNIPVAVLFVLLAFV